MEKKLPLLSTEKNKKEIDSLILLKLYFYLKRDKSLSEQEREKLFCLIFYDFSSSLPNLSQIVILVP
jgi:hypothetical protein